MPRTRLRAEHLEDRVTPVTLPPGFAESVIASGLIAPDGRVFVAEQGGTLRVAQNGTVLPTPFVSLTVDSTGERGLIGVALDPNFASNPFGYAYYTVPDSLAHNRVSRFTAVGNTAAPGSRAHGQHHRRAGRRPRRATAVPRPRAGHWRDLPNHLHRADGGLAVGAGPGGGPVAVRNVDTDAAAEIIAGTASGTPGVGIYKVGGGTATQLGSFLAFAADFTGGVFVG